MAPKSSFTAPDVLKRASVKASEGIKKNVLARGACGKRVIDKPTSAIALTRVPDSRSHILNMRVFIDGKEIGLVPNADRKVFPVEPGDHEVYVRMEMNRVRSEPIHVHVPEGETVELWESF